MNSFFSKQNSAQTVLRGCEEQCGSPRVRTTSLGHMPVLLSRLSETSSVDENSETDSVPCSPLSMGVSAGRSPMGNTTNPVLCVTALK